MPKEDYFVDLTCDSPERVDRGESFGGAFNQNPNNNGRILPSSLADIMAARNANPQPRMTAQYLNQPVMQSHQPQHRDTFQHLQQPHKQQPPPYVMGQYAKSSAFHRMPTVGILGEELDPLAAHIAKSKMFQQHHQNLQAANKGKISTIRIADTTRATFACSYIMISFISHHSRTDIRRQSINKCQIIFN